MSQQGATAIPERDTVNVKSTDVAAGDGVAKDKAKGTEDLWHIKGKVYDLHQFLKKHPGGPQVLLSVRGTDDLTAIFESNHAFMDKRKVEKVMDKYWTGAYCEVDPGVNFIAGGFYDVVT